MDLVVSIIVPSFNRVELLKSCVQSIIDQSYENIELIIVDDGSTDATRELVEQIQGGSSRTIKYLYQKNSGAPTARNNGLNHSIGEYVVFFDSDDIMHKDRIELQLRCILNEGADACAAAFFDGEKVIIPSLIPNQSQYVSYLKGVLVGSTQAWMFRKSLILSIGGYDEALSCFQDQDLVFRMLCLNPKITVLGDPLTQFVDRAEVRVSSIGKTQKGLDSFILAHSKRLEFFVLNNLFRELNIEILSFCRLLQLAIRLGSNLSVRNIYECLIRVSMRIKGVRRIFVLLRICFYFVLYVIVGNIRKCI